MQPDTLLVPPELEETAWKIIQTPSIYEPGSACLINRKTLAPLLNGHAGISPETRTCQGARSAGVAVRLSKAFGRTPPGRLAAVADVLRNLAQIRQQADRIQVTPFGRPETGPVIVVI